MNKITSYDITWLKIFRGKELCSWRIRYYTPKNIDTFCSSIRKDFIFFVES